jgi:NAD(P)-dependent dehydrogenase (short-subunit alcohol dehydrogenase family)
MGLLEGKTALITGGASGIGRAAAIAFAREGARVAVCDKAEDGARSTVETINQQGGQSISIAVDVSRTEEVAAMVDRVIASFGRLDCAFNNAGIASQHVGAAGLKTAEWSEESWSQLLAINLTGVWLCMKHELPRMLEQGAGAIVNTASVAGLGCGLIAANK